MAETRKIAAILVADVVGYSRLAGADEEGTLARLRALRSDLIDPAVAAHHGRVVKRTGDGFICEFRSIVDAVRCAIEVQNGMLERNADVAEDRRIQFRVGVHLGDIVEEADGDLMGDGVNIAARIEGIAEPGAICLSEQAYWQVKGRLDLAVCDLGQAQLKNIAEPIRIYSLDVGASAAKAAPAPEKFAAPRLSIVVLPFKSLSSDPDQDYFADGVTENLTTDLSRVRNSFVIARNTAFTFKGQAINVKRIANELGVRYVLEGSIQRDQNRVRVNAQLIDGETGAHLWADRFQEDVADLFRLQDQIVAKLANALQYELEKAEAQKGAAAQNPDAIDLVMRGRSFLQETGLTRKVSDARASFEQALKLDADNSHALEGDARAHLVEFSFGARDPNFDYEAKILGQANKAIAADRGNVYAYETKSLYLALTSRPAEALRVADAGLSINPNSALLLATRSVADIYSRRFQQAKLDIEQAILLSPRDPQIAWWSNLCADAELGLGHIDAALDASRRAIEGGYRNWYSYLNLATASAVNGHLDQAKSALAEARRVNPRLSVKFLVERKPILQPWFDALRKAGLPEE